jgi:opacity protein-like surface antigen
MRRAVAFVVLAALASIPLPASASELDLRIGAFFPRADSNLFDDNRELYGFGENDPLEKSDWIGVYGGAEWRFRVAPSLYIGVHLDGYGRTLNTEYVDFERPSGRPIEQSLKLNIVPLGASLRWVPRDGRRDISPYLGGGIDAVFYQYEEFGDFIDFFDDELPVIEDHFEDDGAALGFHALAGLRVPVSDDISLTGEARYLWARKDMGDDFGNDLRIDLSGLSATFGVSIRF